MAVFGANCGPSPTGDGPPFLAMHKGHIFGKIAPEVIIHLTAADMHVDYDSVDYDSALVVVQSSKARQSGDLVSRTKLFIKDVSQLCIASNS